MQCDIVVVHGANSAAVEIKPLADLLAPYGRIHMPNLLGHGGREISEKISMQAVAEDLIGFLDGKNIARAIVVGYSLGGYIGLYLARHYPDRIIGVCGVATKFIFDKETITHWVYLGSPERLGREGNPRKQVLESIHAPQDWEKITVRNQGWYRDLGDHPPLSLEDFSAIKAPVWLFSGKKDPVVSVDEQVNLARILNTRVGLFPGTLHPLYVAPLPELSSEIGKWIATLPVNS